MKFRRLELNGGRVLEDDGLLLLPATASGYADAQIDDYGLANGRGNYPWRPGSILSLRARFSHGRETLKGTAGFGFWNAPFGDPTVGRPALPQAAWFFFASEPSDLPFVVEGAGRGWFVATLDATTPQALLSLPLAPAVLLFNQSRRLSKFFWPPVRRLLQISHAPIDDSMADWHEYELQWKKDGCAFFIDGQLVMQTPYSPRGPLGFVCWIDNQYMVATSRGRFGAGVLETTVTQSLEINDLRLENI